MQVNDAFEIGSAGGWKRLPREALSTDFGSGLRQGVLKQCVEIGCDHEGAIVQVVRKPEHCLVLLQNRIRGHSEEFGYSPHHGVRVGEPAAESAENFLKALAVIRTPL